MQACGKGRMLGKALVHQFQQHLHIAAGPQVKVESGCCSRALFHFGWLA